MISRYYTSAFSCKITVSQFYSFKEFEKVLREASGWGSRNLEATGVTCNAKSDWDQEEHILRLTTTTNLAEVLRSECEPGRCDEWSGVSCIEWSTCGVRRGLVTPIPSSPRLACPLGFGGHFIHNLMRALQRQARRGGYETCVRWDLQKQANDRNTLADKVVTASSSISESANTKGE